MKYFDAAGRTSPASRLTSMSSEAERQPAAARPDERAGLLPGGRPADLLLLRVGLAAAPRAGCRLMRSARSAACQDAYAQS